MIRKFRYIKLEISVQIIVIIVLILYKIFQTVKNKKKLSQSLKIVCFIILTKDEAKSTINTMSFLRGSMNYVWCTTSVLGKGATAAVYQVNLKDFMDPFIFLLFSTHLLFKSRFLATKDVCSVVFHACRAIIYKHFIFLLFNSKS